MHIATRFPALLCFILLLPFLTAIKAESAEEKEAPMMLTVYLPVNNAKLKPRKLKSELYESQLPTNQRSLTVIASRALYLLFENAPSYFPKGTDLTELPEIKESDTDVMQVSLSKQFLQRGFWKSKRRALLAVYAIVNTAGQDVQFLVEGKPIRSLANIDLRKPLSPRMDLVVRDNTDK